MAVIESRDHSNFVHTLKLDWATSATTGTVTHTTDKFINGLIERVSIKPDTTAAPTTAYNVVMRDDRNTDVLKGGGAGCYSSVNKEVYLSPAMPVDSKLALTVGAAGTSNAGSIVIFWRES